MYSELHVLGVLHGWADVIQVISFGNEKAQLDTVHSRKQTAKIHLYDLFKN